nr:hypothetical protein [Telmatocola sphagniphila]
MHQNSDAIGVAGVDVSPIIEGCLNGFLVARLYGVDQCSGPPLLLLSGGEPPGCNRCDNC